jgi:hypothetical protein
MKLCRICGKSEDDHHAFDPVELPPGCVCDPGTWGESWKKLPPVCDKYDGDGVENCKKCEHDKECHK